MAPHDFLTRDAPDLFGRLVEKADAAVVVDDDNGIARPLQGDAPERLIIEMAGVSMHRPDGYFGNYEPVRRSKRMPWPIYPF
ncbi:MULTISPECIES: hypothetical protein [Rhodopseudomonas]|uniref:hypothetical protein n=1 Tax=Rhodopseudomonas TaxID=1073 RepID=UPI001FCF0CD0|nr:MULTISPECIES: hypothetical protein [Rhodopseudomonas]